MRSRLQEDQGHKAELDGEVDGCTCGKTLSMCFLASVDNFIASEDSFIASVDNFMASVDSPVDNFMASEESSWASVLTVSITHSMATRPCRKKIDAQ